MKKSWKTTLFGSLAGVSELIATNPATPPTWSSLARGASALFLILLGAVSRDNNVTSEDVGAKPEAK